MAPAVTTLMVPTAHARSRRLWMQLPKMWVTGIDPASGQSYYYNEITGQSQWEPPMHQNFGAQQGGFGPQVLCRLTPYFGVNNEYAVSNGGEQILGRYDMGPQKPDPRPYISRIQCLVRVADDGTTYIEHVGKDHRPTALRGPNGKWYALKKRQQHVLTHGEQISLDTKNPDGAVYSVSLQQGGAPQQHQQGGASQQQGGAAQQGGYHEQQGGYQQQQGAEGYQQQGGYQQQQGGY